MSMPAAETPDVLAQAARVAAQAAERAGVEVRDLHELEELRQMVDLFDRTWTSDEGSYMPLNLLRALAHAGNHVSSALESGRVVGALVGFFGSYRGQNALHSHMLAVAPATRGRSVGYALKLHQRAWALQRGIQVATWTFDPLMSRNCYINLTRLGAQAAEYLPDFYGRMGDSINAADESDRILAAWWLASERVIAATSGVRRDETSLLAAGRPATVLQVGPGDRPITSDRQGDLLLYCVPTDIDAIRRRDPPLALEWRRALREALGGALAAGYEVETFLRRGCYVLRRSR